MYKTKLMEIGIKPSLQGFYYLNDAITMYNECDKTCYLYYKVANGRGTTASRVERSIRHAISKSNDKMRNGDFIAKYKMLWEQEKQEGAK